MSQRARRETIQAINAAFDAGQTYCPFCGIPLNYHRGGLPNSAVFNTTTDTITCSRCEQRDRADQEAQMPRITRRAPVPRVTEPAPESGHMAEKEVPCLAPDFTGRVNGEEGRNA